MPCFLAFVLTLLSPPYGWIPFKPTDAITPGPPLKLDIYHPPLLPPRSLSSINHSSPAVSLDSLNVLSKRGATEFQASSDRKPPKPQPLFYRDRIGDGLERIRIYECCDIKASGTETFIKTTTPPSRPSPRLVTWLFHGILSPIPGSTLIHAGRKHTGSDSGVSSLSSTWH